MKVESIKDLGKLIDMCHKKGVKSITVDGIALELGEPPLKRNVAKDTSTDEIDTEPRYSDEDLLLWSSIPHG